MPDTLSPITLKKRASAAEIQAELQERIARLAARETIFRDCTAARPKPLATGRDGAPNWTVNGFPGLPSGGFSRMVQLLDQVRMEYELVE